MRASGAKGLPFSMPMDASRPSVSGSIAAAGSSCTTSLTSSKKEKSIAWMVLNALPETLTKFVAGGIGRLRQRIDAQALLDVGHRRLRVALHQKAARAEEVAEGGRPEDVIPVGHVARVIRGQEQEPAALALVGTGIAQVGDVVEPEVVDQAQRVGRALDDDRAVLEVEPGHRVDALGVAGEEQRARVHQRLEDEHGLVVGAEVAKGLALRVLATRPAWRSGTPARRAGSRGCRRPSARSRRRESRRRT